MEAKWCGVTHRIGHACARPVGHSGYHRSYSGAIWIRHYIRYGDLDDNGQSIVDQLYPKVEYENSCAVDIYSSRACEFGTKGCVIKHIEGGTYGSS